MVAINSSAKDSSHPRAASPRFNTTLIIIIGCTATLILFFMEFYARFRHTIDTSTQAAASSLLIQTKEDSSLYRIQQEQCQFFLAESAIPKAGLGIYTAIDIKRGEMTQSMPDICIYVADTPSGTSFKTHSWNGRIMKGAFEGGYPRAACEGVATLVNTMPEGVRTSILDPIDIQTNGGLERTRDPGAGAITQYYGVSSVATRDVQAGYEVTITYGDWHFKSGIDYHASPRSVEWLRKYGMCIDHIEIKTANDPSMGRGAFAKHNLKAGGLVAPAPLQIFSSREKFAQQIPEALLVNYCYQPQGLDMLLFPYGPGVNLINHSSKNPNVELRWSNNPMNHAQWLSLPLNLLEEMMYPGGLILEIVAIRDIQQGEELFMDYGSEWEQAWNKHVAEWKPVAGAADYVYPADMDLTEKFRTVEEQQSNPYPKNLATVCPTRNKRNYGGKHFDEPPSRKQWDLKRESDWYKTSGTGYCNILKRTWNETRKEYQYEVSFNWDYLHPDKPDEYKWIDYGVSHSAIYFQDKPYTSDLHLANAFRHSIHFPEKLVPPQWRT